jgi:hypothetical protein
MRILGIVALCASMPTATWAKCEHPPVPWSFGSSISSTWRITDGTACASTSLHPENIAKIEIEARPKHGIAGRNGPFGIAYKPKPGFKGTDTFSYAVMPNANYRNGAGGIARVTIHVISE